MGLASSEQKVPSKSRIHVLMKRMPVNCPIIRRSNGIKRKTALCCASSTLCALADTRTVKVMAISEMAGETSSITRSHLGCGITKLPVITYVSISTTVSIAANEMEETNMLRRKAAATLDRKIDFKDRGQYKRVSSVRFSFSPTKDEAAITDEAIIGIIRKKTGRI